MKKYIEPLARKTEEELLRELNESRIKLNGYRFDLAQGKIKNVQEIRSVKKTIARILTLLHKK